MPTVTKQHRKALEDLQEFAGAVGASVRIIQYQTLQPDYQLLTETLGRKSLTVGSAADVAAAIQQRYSQHQGFKIAREVFELSDTYRTWAADQHRNPKGA